MTDLDFPEPGAAALVAPGVYDALSALIAEQAGARALYLSGASVSYTQLGRPDLGFTDLSIVADVTRRVTDRVATPLIVDADTGFGNALNVGRTVKVLERAGAAAIQLEDQALPKRCGHLSGKRLVPADEMIGKIKAALDARDRLSIIARTDALGVEGLSAAFERAERYLAAGADALFIEALRSDEELAAAGAQFGARVPLVANMVEGGRTPLRDAAALGALGFRIVICPGALARAFAFMAQDFLGSLLADGSTAAHKGRMLTFDQLNAAIGLPEMMEAGAAYDGTGRKAAE